MLTTGQFFQWVKTMKKKGKIGESRVRIRSAGTFCCAILLHFCGAALFDSGSVQGQSTLVESGFMNSKDAVSNSLSQGFLQTEAFLSQPVEGVKLTLDQFVRRVRDQGIAVWLDYEVQQEVDDAILTFAKSPTLAHSMGHALHEYDVAYSVMHDGALKIILKDDADSSKHFINVVYDITPLVDDWSAGDELLMSMQDSVWNDSWRDTGTGEGTISLVTGRGGKFFFNVSQSYHAQMSVRRSLNDLKRLGGSSVSDRLNRSRSARDGNSSVVVLPLHATAPGGFNPRLQQGGVF